MAKTLSLQVVVLTAVLLCTQISPSYSNDVYSSVILGATNYFNTKCVYFIGSAGITTNVHTVKARKVLSELFVSSAVEVVKTTTSENELTLKRDCSSPLYVIFNDVNTRELLVVLSKRNELRKGTWIIFLGEYNNLEEYFLNVYIPFDCEFLVAEQGFTTGILRLTEIYRVIEKGQLKKYSFGFWSSKLGFVGPERSFYDRRNNLDGITFRTTNNEEDAPITYLYRDGLENGTRLGGFSGQVWKIFETRMGFSSVHSVPADGMWGSLNEDGSWDGMIGDLLYDKANMTAMGITVTSERAEYVRFSSPLFVSYVRIYIQEPSREISIWGLVSPFRPKLWCALLFSVFASSLILTLLCKLEGKPDYLEGHNSLKDIFFHFFAAMFCQQALISNHQAFSKRIVVFVIYFIGTIALSAYSGSVISYLAVRKDDLPFTSLTGLLGDGTYTLGMVKTTWYHTLFKNAKKYKQSIVIQQLYDRHISTDPRNTPTTYEEGFQRACDQRYGFITEEEAFFSLNWNCTLQSLPVQFAITSIAYAFQKDSPYFGLFSHNQLKLMNNGVLRKLYKDALKRNLPSENKSIHEAASLDTIKPILLLLCAGYLIALFILALEVIVFHLSYTEKRHIVPFDE